MIPRDSTFLRDLKVRLRHAENTSEARANRMLLVVSMTMVVAPLTFLWDGRWQDPSSVPGGNLARNAFQHWLHELAS